MDCIVQGIAKSQTRLSDFHFHLVEKLCWSLFWLHGLQPAKLLCLLDFLGKNTEGIAIFFSMGSSWPRYQTQVSYIAGRFFTTDTPGKPLV